MNSFSTKDFCVDVGVHCGECKILRNTKIVKQCKSIEVAVFPNPAYLSIEALLNG